MRLISLGLAALTAGPAFAADETASREFFESRVRPVFARNCSACHSAGNKMAGLDMSTRDGLLKGGQSGAAVIPGKPEDSLIVRLIAHRDEKRKMPMGQAKLDDARIADIARWIQEGAWFPEPVQASAKKKYAITADQRAFWAFQPVRKQEPPVVKNTAWSKTAIDRFLMAKIEARRVVAAKPADKRTLLRRAYYDLTGLPPSAADVEAFERDAAPDAFDKVVDRLLQSPSYGERWARYWLDVARYSDDRLESEVDAPYPNGFRYRDWVIQALNDDMPYDKFVKAQIAGDQMGDSLRYAAGLGFYALRPDTQDDRVDVTGRAFLGLTTGCAQCHDHKFDPIPTTDYYALLGVFTSTKDGEYPLAPEAVVKEYKERQKAVDDKKAQIRDLLHAQATQLSQALALQTARYARAARLVLAPGLPESQRRTLDAVMADGRYDKETLQRWVKYLSDMPKDHPHLKDWTSASFDADAFQERVLAVLAERKSVDEENAYRRAAAKKQKGAAPEVVSLKTDSFYLWRDLFFNDFYGNQFKQEDDGLLYYGPNRGFYESDGTVERLLDGFWKEHLVRLREELASVKARLPAPYPFLHTIEDSGKLKREKVRVSGSDDNLGEEVPRRFLTILSNGEPFAKGSGRAELADAIASPGNPLTARVMLNRIWQYHFGAGIVRTPSDFGFMGDRPSHPELLDYLAARFVESGWSMKAMHREIMLSAAYRAGSERLAANESLDPDNRLFWRSGVRRLDAEALRDSLLAVSGELDFTPGGFASPLSEETNRRRAVYGFVSRRKTDSTLALFDFPNPNATSEKRPLTITPPQQLYFLNGGFVANRAQSLAERSAQGGGAAPERIARLYRLVFGRAPSAEEARLGAVFTLAGPARWAPYAQALLSSNEFLFVN